MARDAGLSKSQLEILEKCRNAKEYEVVTIGGIDYDTLVDLSEDHIWAEEMLNREYGGWILKVGDAAWQPASNSCFPPTYTEDELIELITHAQPIETNPNEIETLVCEYLGEDFDEMMEE